VLADDRSALIGGHRGFRFAVAVDQELESHLASSAVPGRRTRARLLDMP